MCSTTTGHCAGKIIGDYCDQNEECSTLFCSDGICNLPEDLDYEVIKYGIYILSISFAITVSVLLFRYLSKCLKKRRNFI